MSQERFLVTGALGCIGAWAVRNLVQEGVPTAVYDLGLDTYRLKLIMSDEELAQVQFIQGNITDLDGLERVLGETGTTNIVHLVGLQVPFCKANPPLGAAVNVVGTVNMFEAAKRAGLKHLAYASSIAIYGLAEDYPAGPIAHDALAKPHTHYGVYKQANEGTAHIYWWDDGISSIGLRPYTVYGPARDQGLTSEPTKAMLAAAEGQGHHIAFGGRTSMQLADDVAKIFIMAARAADQASFAGADTFNLRGSVVSMTEIIAAIEQAEPAATGQITFEDVPLPFPIEMDDSALIKTLGPLPDTPLDTGVLQTIAIFKEAIAQGRLKTA